VDQLLDAKLNVEFESRTGTLGTLRMISGMRRDDSKLGVDNKSYPISLFPGMDLVSAEEGIT
jgi:hypothetical protein